MNNFFYFSDEESILQLVHALERLKSYTDNELRDNKLQRHRAACDRAGLMILKYFRIIADKLQVRMCVCLCKTRLRFGQYITDM